MSFRKAVVIAIAIVCCICSGCQSSTTASASSGFTTSSAVKTVCDGVLPEPFNTTTVGKAFGGTFQNGKWSSFETPKGETVVQFDGTIPVSTLDTAGFVPDKSGLIDPCKTKLGVVARLDELYKEAEQTRNNVSPERDAIWKQIAECIKTTQMPVKFQFTLSADKKTFRISFINADAFGNVDGNEVVKFVYR